MPGGIAAGTSDKPGTAGGSMLCRVIGGIAGGMPVGIPGGILVFLIAAGSIAAVQGAKHC